MYSLTVKRLVLRNRTFLTRFMDPLPALPLEGGGFGWE
jgi:hypothetical protein